MLILGLTGGIASGKSTATDYFARRGVPVIDADKIVHELIQSGTQTFNSIVSYFGNSILSDGHEIDRSKLRDIIFSDDVQRKKLESILHPEVRKQIRHQLDQLDAPYCVVCIPLLVETGHHDLVDRILVIDIDPDTQVQRLKQRDKLPPALIQKILAAQATRSQRLAAADDVILNNSDITGFEVELEKLHNKYINPDETPEKTEN